MSSPFNEEKYNRLLKGLEISEIKYSQLNTEHRIDAEYFLKRILANIKKLSNYGTFNIGSIATVTDGIHTSIDYSDNSSINLISATSPKDNVFDLSRAAFISEKAHAANPRTALRNNDVIISTVGTIGNCAVVDDSILPANSDRHVGIIRINTDFSPYTLSTFLLSKYGRTQTLRESTGNVQLNLFIYKLREINIPNFSKIFQNQIDTLVKTALTKLQHSNAIYQEAESSLLSELRLSAWRPNKKSINVKTFNNSYSVSGRLDAEYYQPKYDELFSILANYDCNNINEIAHLKKSVEPGSGAYCNSGIPFVRVSDITKFGIETPDIFLSPDEYNLNELRPLKNTILLSKDGSVGIAYKVREDLNCITSGALLHLTVFNEDYDPDYLTLVLNSVIVQMQAERDSNGAIIQHWKPSEIGQVIIPKLPKPVQQNIALKIQESFKLREESQIMLDEAKRMVENEIER